MVARKTEVATLIQLRFFNFASRVGNLKIKNQINISFEAAWPHFETSFHDSLLFKLHLATKKPYLIEFVNFWDAKMI
jgi:hypothetical protein